jgi:hypothetical protein
VSNKGVSGFRFSREVGIMDANANGWDDAQDEIEMVEDVSEAIRRARENDERLVLGRDGQALVAVLPLRDLRLLLRLEEEELDRIDLEGIARLKESGAYQDRVSWDAAKTESLL